MWKLKVCLVAVMVEAEDLEVVRVSAGSVVIQAIIHAPVWREALAVLAADVAAGILTYPHVCSRILTYPHVRSRTLTHAHACSRMLRGDCGR